MTLLHGHPTKIHANPQMSVSSQQDFSGECAAQFSDLNCGTASSSSVTVMSKCACMERLDVDAQTKV